MAFSGIHDHNLDAKNRLTVPSKMRPDLGEQVVVAKTFQACLAIWPRAAYEQIVEQTLAGMNPLAPETRDLKRRFFANAQQTEIDAAGRVMIPPKFMAHAGLGREVVLSGTGDCIEVWDREAWAIEEQRLEDATDQLTAKLRDAR